MSAKANATVLGERVSGRGETTDAIRANLMPLDRVGNYRIDARGFSLKSRYPINRMAKVLFDSGSRGRLEVYGPSADDDWITLRYSCAIEKMAARRMTEGDRGIRFVAWTEKSLAALERVTKRHPFVKDAKNQRPDPGQPESNNWDSLGKGFRGEFDPVIDPSSDSTNFNNLPVWRAAREREIRDLALPARRIACRLGLDGTTARLLASLAYLDGGDRS